MRREKVVHTLRCSQLISALSLGVRDESKKKLHTAVKHFFFFHLSLPPRFLATMCGILAALGLDSLSAEQARRLVLQASKQQRHRGPDDTSAVQLSGGADVIAFERLLIIDPTSSGRYGFIF